MRGKKYKLCEKIIANLYQQVEAAQISAPDQRNISRMVVYV